MESIDSNPATIGCQPNILQSLPGGYRRRRQIYAIGICYQQSGPYHFFAELFIESPDLNDTTNMCQALWCLCIPWQFTASQPAFPEIDCLFNKSHQ